MEAEVRASVKEMEKTEQFPAEAIKKLGEMGCCGLLVPERVGRAGIRHGSYVLMLEEVARVFTALSTAISVTNSAVQAPLLLFGTEAQKKKYLRRMATGETLGAFCLTEPAAGSDAAGIQARAVRVGIVTNSANENLGNERSVAGVLLVFAKTDPARAEGHQRVSGWSRDSPAFARGGMRTRWDSGRRRRWKFAE